MSYHNVPHGSNAEHMYPNHDDVGPEPNNQWPDWKRECVFGAALRERGFVPLDGDWNTWKRSDHGLTCYVTLPNHPAQPVVVSLKYTHHKIGASTMTLDAQLWQLIRAGANNALIMGVMLDRNNVTEEVG